MSGKNASRLPGGWLKLRITTNTMKTLTLQVTDEQEEQIQKILRENELPFRAKDGDKIYVLCGDGDIINCTFYDESYDDGLSQGNIFPTREAAEMAKLRRESAVERYMPKMGEEYKTFSRLGNISTSTFDSDILDMHRFHSGMMWSTATPDSEIEAWLKKYKEAWMFGVKK